MATFLMAAHCITHHQKSQWLIPILVSRKSVNNWSAVKLKMPDTSFPKFSFDSKGQILPLATNTVSFSCSESFSSFIFDNKQDLQVWITIVCLSVFPRKKSDALPLKKKNLSHLTAQSCRCFSLKQPSPSCKTAEGVLLYLNVCCVTENIKKHILPSQDLQNEWFLWLYEGHSWVNLKFYFLLILL